MINHCEFIQSWSGENTDKTSIYSFQALTRNMKKWFLLISYIIFLSQQITKAQQVINLQNITSQLNDFLQMANKFYQFNGSAIISYKGTILLNKGYGFKNIAGNEMNDSGTIFQIGSVTKEFTSKYQ